MIDCLCFFRGKCKQLHNIINPSVGVLIRTLFLHVHHGWYGTSPRAAPSSRYSASSLRSLPHAKERKKKKKEVHSLYAWVGCSSRRTLTRRALARRGSTMPCARNQALHSAHQCTVSFGEEHSSVQQHDVLINFIIIRCYCSQERYRVISPPIYLQ